MPFSKKSSSYFLRWRFFVFRKGKIFFLQIANILSFCREMNSCEVRQSFLQFFENHGHKIVPSSSLMPDAPNLLFTNAGMNQFVPIFLGNSKTHFKRAADTQKCIRAGGKHNDLEDVGFDTYHHTFFEMLGNWSFGDYFKKEAIALAWELLTKVWKFPKERLYATVYSPKPGEPAQFDQEAYDLWKEIFEKEGMDPRVHIQMGSKKENFWMMGDTGPCGPCSEIHMDLTPKGDTQGKLVNQDSPWCIELWNLVFMQFQAMPDGTFVDLKEKNIDTGMGLERVVGIFAKTKNFSDFSQLPSNYDSDLFSVIFAAIEKMTDKRYRGTLPSSRSNMSEQERIDFMFRAIADHIRTLSFSVADGIFPSNEGRGYVLRRILRRAVMFGNLLQLPTGFFAQLSHAVVDKMGKIFPELHQQQSVIETVLKNEETSFAKTIDRGLALFKEICGRSATGVISGEDVFLLYDTYGFPMDLTQVLAEEQGLRIDYDGFEHCMENQRSLARRAQKKSAIELSNSDVAATVFKGYDIDHIQQVEATVKEMIEEKGKSFLIVDQTPFYAECGGEVGDIGQVVINGKSYAITDVQKNKNGTYWHAIDLKGDKIEVGSKVELSVDRRYRLNIMRNHSATHILQYALRKVLGDHVKQAGSYVDAQRLRFDFNTFTAPTPDQLNEVERIVAEKILEALPSSIFEVAREEVPEGCIANFGEKYGDVVRVVKLGDFSTELCGGCHVRNTSEIEVFKIKSCSAVASGIRRIEAVTGEEAIHLFYEQSEKLHQAEQLLNCAYNELEEKIATLMARTQEQEKKLKAIRNAELEKLAQSLVETSVRKEDGQTVVEGHLKDYLPDELKQVANMVLSQTQGVVVLFSEKDGRCHVIVCCSKLAVNNGYHAGKMLKEIVTSHGGAGGGRPEFAMGGYALV